MTHHNRHEDNAAIDKRSTEELEINELAETLSESSYQKIQKALKILDMENIPFFDDLRNNGIHQERMERLKSFSLPRLLNNLKIGITMNLQLVQDYFNDLLQPATSGPMLAVRSGHDFATKAAQAKDWTLSHVANDEGWPVELTLQSDRPDNGTLHLTIIGIQEDLLTRVLPDDQKAALSQDDICTIWTGTINSQTDQPRLTLSFELPTGSDLAEQQPIGRELLLGEDNGHWILALRLNKKA